MTRFRLLAAVLIFVALAPGVRAEEKPAFTLSKAVPADVFVYVHATHNPESEYLEKYWGEVWAAFKKTNVIEDVHTLIASAQDPAGREKFETFWKRAGELIDGVDWKARVHEFVYASRMSSPMPEYVVLLRYDEDKAAKNADAFAAVLKEIETAAEGEKNGVTYTEQQSRGATVRSLGFKEVPFLNLRVAVRGPVVALALDRTLLDESLALLAGEGDKTGLTATQRYREAMAKLPPPEDAAAFFDVRAMLNGIKTLIGQAVKQAGDQAGQDPEAKEVVQVVNKILDEFTCFDYVASTTHTEGYRQISQSIAALAPDASRSRLYKVFATPEPIEKFDRFIPKEATGYSVCSGIDFSALYAAVLDFIDKEVSGGKDLLTEWDKTQEQIGFNAQRDLFSWLGSQIISVSLPAAAPSPFSSGDSVLFVKVRNEKQAAEKVKAGLDKLNAMLTRYQQPLTSQPAQIEGAEGFRTVTHPLVALFLHPVYGVAEGYLIIGSSPEAVQACLDTAHGKRPSVAGNERVIREGLIPKGPVTSASFSDMTDLGKNIAQVLSAMGMVSAMIPNQPDTRPIREAIGIAGKLSPVAMKLNFFLSQSSVTTFEKNAWHTQSVINYKPPKPAQAESPAPGGS